MALHLLDKSLYPPFLTVRQAAELLGVNKSTIYRNKDDLPVRRVGRTVRIDRDALFAEKLDKLLQPRPQEKS